MGYLDATEITGDSRFTAGDLAWSQQLLTAYFGFLNESWLRRPRGLLAEKWKSSDTESLSFLIHLAMTLDALLMNIAPTSKAALNYKVKELLRTRDKKAFEQQLTELDAGAVIVANARPLTLEPLAGAGPEDPGRSPSPDFSIDLPDGQSFIEVTQISFGFIDNWLAAARTAAGRMQARVKKRGLSRNIEFAAPILASAEQMGRLSHEDVLSDMARRPVGEQIVRLRSGDAFVRWRTISDHSNPEPLSSDSRLRFTIDDSGDVEYKYVGAVTFHSVIEGDLEDKVVRSMRHSLDDKLDQTRVPAPYVLIARIDQVDASTIANLILKRIFPNDAYARLSAIALFPPARSWRRGEEFGEEIKVVMNDHARHPVTETLRDVLLARRYYFEGQPADSLPPNWWKAGDEPWLDREPPL